MNPNEKTSSQVQAQVQPMIPLDNSAISENNSLPAPTDTSLYAQNENSQDVTTVLKTYMKLSKLFFWVGVYVIIGLIVFWIVRKITLPDSLLPFPLRSEENIGQEEVLQSKIKGISEQDIKANDLVVVVKQGELHIDEKKLTSVNNLIIYQWFTLPQKTLLYLNTLTGALQKSTHFVAGWYTLDDVDAYLKTIIFDNYLPSPNLNPVVLQWQLLQTPYSFVEYFGMQCLLYPNLGINRTCDKVTSFSLPTLAVYNLASHYDDIRTIAKRVQGTTHQEEFCGALQQYLFVSNDVSNTMKEIITYCGEKYETMFTEFSSFRTIQDQLTKQTILSNVTSSAVLNSYKLVSVMQEIYHEITKGNNINELRIGSYIDYVRSLLKNTQYIQWFYMDIIGRYNNAFLIPKLTQSSLTARGEIASEYRKLLLELNELNDGSNAKWFVWLDKLVSLTWSLIVVSNGGEENWSWTVVEDTSLLHRFQDSFSFSNYVISESKENDDHTISVTGRLRVSDEIWLANNSPLNIIFMYKDQRFYAQSVQMPRHLLLALSINQKLAIQPLVMSELYNLILQTQNTTAQQPISQDVCTAFTKDDGMVSCTENNVKFVRDDTTYIFTYSKNAGVTAYTVNPSTLETQLKSVYGSSITITKDPVQAINIVMSYVPNTQTTDSDSSGSTVWWLEEVQLQKNFDEIWATIKNVMKSQQYITVEFSLQSYDFTSLYDPNTQSIVGLWIVINGATNTIRNFKFSFPTSTSADRELLKSDPKTFLLQFDPLTVKRLQL